MTVLNLRNLLQAHVGENVEVYFLNEVVEGKILTTNPNVFVIEIYDGTYINPFTEASIPYHVPSYVRALV